MTDRTAATESVTQSTKRTGRVYGSQEVGDYVGQPAGEAAQAVRRAGLRAGLDRSFGSPMELIGLVVAQDPVAGSELARNGMVTLYVAAPGGEPPSSDAGAAPVDGGQTDDELTAQRPIEEGPSRPPVTAGLPRRRKPGPARRFTEPPARTSPPPAVIESAAPQDASAQRVFESPGVWSAEVDAPQGALEDDQSERAFAHEDFVVHVEDVFAGRSRLPGWRRTYPRRVGSGGRFRAWLGEHRLLAGGVGLALGLWMLVGVASTLDSHHAHTSPANAVAPKRAPGTTHLSPASKATATPKLSAHRTTARPALVHPERGERHAAGRRGSSTAPWPVRAASPAVSEAVASAPGEAPAPRPSRVPTPQASTPPAPAPGQSGGGLFSP